MGRMRMFVWRQTAVITIVSMTGLMTSVLVTCLAIFGPAEA